MDIYKITVLNWAQYNPNKKKGHRATLISNDFCHDNKLGVLPLTVRWLFLGIILTCGRDTRDTIEMNKRQLRALLESSWSIDRALESLQSLQLLTFEKKTSFLNRIEKKRKEKKRKETERTSDQQTSSPTQGDKTIPVSTKQTKAGAFIAGYKLRFKNRWGVAVNVEGKDSAIAKRIAERLSYEDIDFYLDAFFLMPDAELVKKKHPVFLFEIKLNEVTVFAQSGEFTTTRQASQADSMAAHLQLLKRIEEGDV